MTERLYNFIIYSNIFIALAALCQSILYVALHGISPDPPLLIFTFSGTVVAYLYAVGYPLRANYNSENPRLRWMSQHNNIVHTIMSIACITCFISFIYLQHKLFIIGFGMFTLLYNLNIKRIGFNGLRALPYFKIISIALVWTVLSQVYPALIYNIHINFWELLRFALKFLWVIALTIPFDVRDLYEDREQALQTFATLLGENKSIGLSSVLFVLISIVQLAAFGLGSESISIVCTSAMGVFINFRSLKRKNEKDYLFKLDGLLILQLFIFYLTESLI